MNEPYKVLNAMLAFEEFSVKEVVRLSGVNSTAVRSVISDRSDLVEPIGDASKAEPEERRFLRYRLRTGMLGVLRTELEKAYADSREVRSYEASGEIGSLEPPIGLVTAEDILKHRYRQAAGTSEKKHLLEIVEIDLKGAREEIQSRSYSFKSTPNPLFLKLKALEQAMEQQRSSLAALAELDAALAKEKLSLDSDPAPDVWNHVKRAADLVWNLVAQPQPAIFAGFDLDFTSQVDCNSGGFARNITISADETLVEWRHHICEILAQQHQASVTVLKTPISMRQGSHSIDVTIRDCAQDVFLLGINSEVDASAAEICQYVLDVWRPWKLFVLDIGVNSDIRNHILENRGHYEPCALSLANDALLAMLNLTVQSRSSHAKSADDLREVQEMEILALPAFP